MNLSILLPLFKGIQAGDELGRSFHRKQRDLRTILAPEAVRPFLIAFLLQEWNDPALIVTARPEAARKLYDDLQVWCTDSTGLRFFPETDFLDDQYTTVNPLTMMERIQVLSTLVQYRERKAPKLSPPWIVTHVSAAASQAMAIDSFSKEHHWIEVGMVADPLLLLRRWQDLGYEIENIVEIPGTVGRRGGIIDIFSPNTEMPARIEFLGNQIDSIRFFDPKTQRSLEQVESIVVVPAREDWENYKTDTIFDYFSKDTLLIADDDSELETTITNVVAQAEEFSHVTDEYADLNTQPQKVKYQSWPVITEKMERFNRKIMLFEWHVEKVDGMPRSVLPVVPVTNYGGRLDAFIQDIQQVVTGGERTVIVSQQADRIAELLQEHDIIIQPVSELSAVPPQHSVTLLHGSMNEGWAINGIMAFLTDREIFGTIKKRRLTKKRPVRHHWSLTELVLGEYVVHVDHGIAKFAGTTAMSADGTQREYLVLEYAAHDKLFVPIDQIDCVSRYIGTSDRPPTPSRLGTQEWTKTKQRVRQSVIDMAEELLDLYASRELVEGYSFSADSTWQKELESSFPYIETLDQLASVEAVKNDMERPRPMDRLVCGDVGYGKTEVALRAAFKAVMDNKQVAVLVPTTVLAQQHFNTFRDRLQVFPVTVEMLSRFCTEKEQSETVQGLANGTVDICIGTHRLLQRDVTFKKLGLVIIDEEQRFGVVNKEHFKKLRQEIDVLTLSATPIPRTLHMSLVGIRDMSTIDTPPDERLPITTHVGTYNDKLVREAILRELERSGQAFYVHNRVQSIAWAANKLRDLVPEAKISVAHGQMAEDDLEEVMTDFADGKSDVLATTTIIESGLDLPNVNTLVIDRADRLGLTQLYQLRGRIGRGSNHAYAYFLFEKGKQLTPQAKKRLSTIAEATELGAGFAIAMKDLEIRGAGNLLGTQQSGYIAAVGFDLYCNMLAEAVETVRRQRFEKQVSKHLEIPGPSIALPLDAHIPESYIEVLDTRLHFYRSLNSARQDLNIEDIKQELLDRFGPLPTEVENLLYIVRIRQMAMTAGVESISIRGREVVLLFHSADDLRRLELPSDIKEAVTIGNRQIRLDIKQLGNNWSHILLRILESIKAD